MPMLPFLNTCSRKISTALPSREEVASSFPKTVQQEEDVTRELAAIFDSHVYQTAFAPFNAKKFSERSFFKIDGVVSEDEFPLYSQSVDILSDILLNRVTIDMLAEDLEVKPEDVPDYFRAFSSTIIRAQQLTGSYLDQQIESAYQRKTFTVTLPDDLHKQFAAATKLLFHRARPHEKVILGYFLKESQQALASGRQLEFVTGTEFSLPDLSGTEEFGAFLQNRSPLIGEYLPQFSGSVIDYVDSGSDQNPNLVVLLDLHKDLYLNRSNLHDAALLRYLDPVLGVEAYYYNDDISVLRNLDLLLKQYRQMNQQREEVDEIVVSGPMDGGSLINIHAHVLQSLTLLMWEQKKGTLDFDRREKLFDSELAFLASAKEQLHTFEIGSRLLYPELDVRGYEYSRHDDYDRQVESMLEQGEISHADASLLTGANVILRSRAGLDNMLTMMSEKGTSLGVMPMGSFHYSSLSAYARERGGVNVIFIRPEFYDGPMPR